MSIPYESLAHDGLTQLGLTTADSYLDQISQQAAAEQWSYRHFLGYLLEGELKARHQRQVDISFKMARFPYLKHLDDFDFKAQPSLDQRLIDELATLRFLKKGQNIVFLGPPGVGKTHLAIALGVKTVENGQRAYFISAIDMVRKLDRALAENRLHRELQNLVRPSLLIIDEVGYIQLDSPQASMLFQVITKRYDKNQSIILTSNKPFSEWGDIFDNDAVMAAAALDRLLHQSNVIHIRGDSYRLNEKRQAAINTKIEH